MKKRTLTARLISLWLVAALMLVGMPVIAQDNAAAPTTAAEPAVTDVAPAAGETAAASSLLGPGELTLEQLALATLPVGDIPDALPAGKVAEKGHVNRLFEQEEGLAHILFQNRDGGKTAYFYGQPVKYIDADGHTRDKSKTLVPVNKTYGALGYDYGVEQNSIRHYYAKDPAVGILVELGGHAVRIIPQAGASLVLPRGQLNENRMVYNNLFGTNTALVYTPLLSGVKEDIILRSFTGQSDFAFTYRTSGLSLINIDGTYAFVDESGLPLATLGDILITDAAGHTALGSLTVTETANGIYTVIVHADRAFLTAPTTVYPVTVDPTINETDIHTTTGNYTNAILDYGLYIDKNAAPADTNNYHYLGYVPGAIIGRVIYQFPGFVKGNSVTSYASIHPDQIVNASLFVCGYPVSGDPRTFVTAYPLTRAWSSNENTMQDALLYNSCKNGTPSVRSLLTLDDFYSEIMLTDIVKAWLGYNMGDDTLPDPANGVVLVDNTETNTGYQKKIRTVEGNDVDVYMTLDYTQNLPGSYYFSNVGLGGLIKKNTTTSATLQRIGMATDLSAYQWTVSYIGNGHYAIRALADQTKYLAVSGGSVTITTVSSSSVSTVPMAARWYMETGVGTGGYIFTNASTLTVLSTGSTLQLSLQAEKTPSASDYANAVWFLFPTAGFTPVASFSVSEDLFLSPGGSTTQTFSATYFPAHATYTGAMHYIWESDNTAFPFISPGILSIPASGGVANITVTNKITGIPYHFVVKCGILQDGIYLIRSKKTGIYMTVENNSSDSGAYIEQQFPHYQDNQKWQVILQENGDYIIQSVSSENYISVENASMGDGANIVQSISSVALYSRWEIVSTINEAYKIISKHTTSEDLQNNRRYAISVPIDNAYADGGNLIQISYTDADYQDEWYFEKLDFDMTINVYFDQAFAIRFGFDTTDAARRYLNSICSEASDFFQEYFYLTVNFNTQLYSSLTEQCKISQGLSINMDTIDAMCPDHPASNDNRSCTLHNSTGNCTDWQTAFYSFLDEHPGAKDLPSILFTGHTLYDNNGEVANRSFSYWNTLTNQYGISMQQISLDNLNQNKMRKVLCHEISHQLRAIDHYHEMVGLACKNFANGCSECSFESVRRPSWCIMANSTTNGEPNSGNFYCVSCYEEIMGYLVDIY